MLLSFEAVPSFMLPPIKVVIVSNHLFFSTEGKLDGALFNIIKEVYQSTGQKVTDLTLMSWEDQGVTFISYGAEKQLERLSSLEGVVFLLWGAEAHSYRHLISLKNNLILETSSPDPFSADLGFFGCGHFIKANVFLADHGKAPIKWGD